jgi:GT2 family glycosyltransferase
MKSVLPRDATVVVVDDGSTDGTSEAISGQFPWVRLLHGDGNLWWSGGVNAGIRYALQNGAGVVMTMNDDTLVTDAFFPGMLEQHRRNPRALLGALELDAETGEISNGGERINWWTGTRRRLWLEDVPKSTGLLPVTHLNGRGLLIPVEVFHKIGLFDEASLPQRCADDDFAHRAARAGFGVCLNYDAPLLVFPDMNPAHALRRAYSLKGYWQNLFGIRGDANLKFFTIYALKNCPLACLPSFLAIGYARRVGGYWLHAPHTD